MNTQLIPILNRWYAAFALALAMFLLAGCVAQPVKQAKVESYSYRVVVQNILEGECYRGNSPKTFLRKFEHIYKNEYSTGTEGIWVIDLKQRPMIVRCTWLAADGARREESANLSELLLPPYFKWDFEDVEILKEQPIQLNMPHVHVELRDKAFRVVSKAKVQYLGEKLPSGSTRVLMREVTNILYERTGQAGK